jgi:cytochrome c oxidase subunit 2
VKHILVASVLVIIVTALLILGLSAVDLVPNLASQEGEFVDQMFAAQIYVIAFIFSLIIVFILYSVVVFRRKPGDTSEGAYFKSNISLEIAWTVIPLAVVMGFGIWSASHLSEITAGEPDELVVEVTGFQFGWRFDYPDVGVSSNQLYLPLGRQTLLNITSQDVIHSFWVPEFRIKQDAVPGRWTTLRVTPSEIGDYRVRCAELCGYAHSAMYAPVVVVEPDDFEVWLAGQEISTRPEGELSLAEKGAQVVGLQGCGGCHSVDGSDSVGPTWLGLFGSMRPMEDGSSVVADGAYLRNAILNPAVHVVAGYPNIMPVYEGVLSDEDLDAVIEYIKTLSE